MSLDIDPLDGEQILDAIFDALDRGEGGWLVTPNLDILRQAFVDHESGQLFGRATLLVADGAPLEWAARLSGREIPGRFPGASLFWSIAEEAAARGRTMLLLGGRPQAGQLAARRLRDQYPGLVVHHHCPPMGFERDAAEMETIRSTIRSLEPDLVICGLGAPKQERLMAQLHPEFPSTWFFGFGATIDFAAGLVPRAPEWMQRSGVEWLFRLATEPRRLGRRYLVQGIPFTLRLGVWAAAVRAARALETPSGRPVIAQVPAQRAPGSSEASATTAGGPATVRSGSAIGGTAGQVRQRPPLI
jgi:N-acetylglucosaminyldiphosphoundecaprenol N-acetyl-beta-D-mannosaminyltransferase